MNIEQQHFVELATRESAWLNTILDPNIPESEKISADEFYRMHKNSSYGLLSYRGYILEKLTFILNYTPEENHHKALRAIVLGENVEYEIPIEFTRELIKSIKERATKALKIMEEDSKGVVAHIMQVLRGESL
jgi:hypothetical protein